MTLLSRERTRSKTRQKKRTESISFAVPVPPLTIPIMSQTFKIATLNINAISSNTCLQMLEDFLWRQDIDFALLQKVSQTTLNTIRRYTGHMNIGRGRLGTGILAKVGLALTNIHRLPSGRGMSASLRGILIEIIYAPSGAEKRQQRDAFYNTEVVHLILSSSTAMILAGDFNCVMTKDCTGQRNCSRALARLIRRLDFIDVWEATPTRTAYAHYTATGTSRIDRIYVTHYLRRRQQGVETVAAAFMDHFAVILRLTMDVPCSPRGKGYWRMNVSFLSDPFFLQTTKENWEKWWTHMTCYLHRVMWWCR